MYLILLFLFLNSFQMEAQNFLNGSFEITSSPVSCNYNLSNASFNALMSNSYAFGSGEELDILVNGCYVTGIPDGVRAVGVADTYDEFSMDLSSPLVAGTSYIISFWIYAETSFRPLGNLEIGVSTTNNTFGNSIGIVSPTSSVWTNHLITFTPSINATNITVRNVMDGVVHWNHVDDFVFVDLLAVDLLSFDAELNDQGHVELKWITSSESNSDKFIVEKSQDGLYWRVLGEYDALGSINENTSYLEFDTDPFMGVSYYRLIEVDMDGSQVSYGIKSIDRSKLESLSIYPNPTNSMLRVNASFDSDSNLKITNSLGQDITSQVSLNPSGAVINIDVSKLTPGTYFISINGGMKVFVKI